MIEERVSVVKEPKKELGLRIRMKVMAKSFSEELDTKNVYLELYNKNSDVKESIRIETELIPKLTEALKSCCRKSKKNRIVAARIVN